MKKILLAMMGVMVVLTGGVWYAKKNNIQLPGVKQVPSTNWQWSNDWNTPSDPNGKTEPTNPVGPPIVNPTPPPQPQPQPNKPAEITLIGYNEAIKKSAEDGKPVLVMFTASWCTWCTKFKQEVLTDASVKAACQNYHFTMIDSDQEKNAIRKFGITGLPSFVITNSKEQKLKFEGRYMDAATFVRWLSDTNMQNQPKVQPQAPVQPQPQPQQDRRFRPFQRQQGNC
jgi:thioredoxin-related protein